MCGVQGLCIPMLRWLCCVLWFCWCIVLKHIAVLHGVIYHCSKADIYRHDQKHIRHATYHSNGYVAGAECHATLLPAQLYMYVACYYSEVRSDLQGSQSVCDCFCWFVSIMPEQVRDCSLKLGCVAGAGGVAGPYFAYLRWTMAIRQPRLTVW